MSLLIFAVDLMLLAFIFLAPDSASVLLAMITSQTMTLGDFSETGMPF